jgi:hypothetical protein
MVFFSQCTSTTSNSIHSAISSDSIVGKWYAPQPDDLTFTFYSDGTFLEQSPKWGQYNGNWEKKFGTYVAEIKDGSGNPKSANFIYNNNQLMTSGITILKRV